MIHRLKYFLLRKLVCSRKGHNWNPVRKIEGAAAMDMKTRQWHPIYTQKFCLRCYADAEENPAK